MKALIIEDERPAAEKLARMIRNVDKGIFLIGPLESVVQTVEWFHQNKKPDLIFMDIQLDDGICFEIFDQVSIDTPIIFTTAYDEYAIRAFQVNSVDYLLKPIDNESLSKALNKYKALYQQEKMENGQYEKVYQDLAKSYKSRFFIKTGMHFKSIPIEEVECFYIRERGVFLRTFSGHNYDLDFSLEQIQQMVDPEKFFRINRNYIVNLIAIKDIHIYSTTRLKLQLINRDAEDVLVSREKVAEFKKWMDK